MSERTEAKKERIRVIPFVRTELSRSEGVRINSKEKTFSFRPLDDQRIFIKEVEAEQDPRCDTVKLPYGETYQHEFSEGQVISIMGGKTGLRGRQFMMYVPTELKAIKTKIVFQKGK